MIPGKRQAGILWALGAGALLIYLLSVMAGAGLNIQTNILSLLPEDESDPVVEQAFDTFSERSMRQLLFLVEAGDRARTEAAAQTLAATLDESPFVSEVMLRVDEDEQQAGAAFAYEHRHRLLNDEDAALLAAGDYATFADTTLARVFSPFSGGLTRLSQRDPFLLSYRFAQANNSAAFPALTVEDGYLLSERSDAVYLLLRARLGDSPFDPRVHADIRSRIEAVEQEWEDVELLRTGAMFYADHAFRTARSEVTFIGGGSLLLIVVLMTLVFFSLRPLLMVALTLSVGIACGIASVRWVFGELHVLTIVFGASLIGVAVDYAFHYFAVDENLVGQQRVQRILPAITLGLLSSGIGYAALGTTPFPGLRQMALFCMSGLTGAWLTVVLVFPLLPLKTHAPPWLLSLCRRVLQGAGGPGARYLFYVVMCAPLIAVILLFKGAGGENDIRQFQAQDNALQRQESRITEILDTPAANQFYLVTGETEEALRENLETAEQALAGMRASGVLEHYQSLTSWLPSERRQQETYALYEGLYASAALEELAAAGVLDDAGVRAARQAFADDREQMLDIEDWLNSPLGEQYGHLWLGQVNDVHAAVIPLGGIQDIEALDDVNSNIIFVDKVATVNDMINTYRDRAGVLLPLAGLCILLLLSLRHGLKRASLVLASPMIAIGVTLSALLLLGESLNLFNTLALFLVLGVGVDFGIFFAEAGRLREQTLLAILLSALTTMFSFGLLSLSQTPVIHSFGLTTLLGIGTALILAPVIGQRLQATSENAGRNNP